MAYDIILPIACVVLAVTFAILSDASFAGKGLVGAVALAGFLVPWTIPAIVLKLLVSLYVVFYFKSYEPGR